MTQRMSYSDLFNWLASRETRETVLVAVDGHGGSGKSTLADRLGDHGDDVRVVHTDDFANAGLTEGLNVERLSSQVIAPLRRGDPGRYQRFDWPSQSLAEWHDVPSGGVVVFEGVSSLRREFGDVWDLALWVEAPRGTCLRRGLVRDWKDALPLWKAWLAEEDRYVARDNPKAKADLVVDGDPDVEHDPAHEFVVVEDRRPSARSTPRTHRVHDERSRGFGRMRFRWPPRIAHTSQVGGCGRRQVAGSCLWQMDEAHTVEIDSELDVPACADVFVAAFAGMDAGPHSRR